MRIRERCARFYDTILNTKFLKLDPTIVDLLSPRLLELSHGDETSMNQVTEVIKGMLNWTTVGPDVIPAELLKLDHPDLVQCFHGIIDVWITREVPQQWK